MVQRAVKLLRESRSARWIVLLSLALPMFASYFFDDFFTTVNQIFENPESVALGWDMADYGYFKSAYSLLCIFGGLIICGMLLDRWGIRITGSIFVGLMALGAIMIAYAISASFAESGLARWMGTHVEKPSLVVAYAGCALFGLGSEIAGVAVNRSIAKWFKGKEMALAMGLQLALARLGTATALLLVPRIMQVDGQISFAETSRPATIGLALILIGVFLWALFVSFDYRYDVEGRKLQEKEAAAEHPEDRFKFSDVLKVLSDRHFILISLLCVFFYCCVVSFRKFATSILIPRFDLSDNAASVMVALIPFFTLIFAPLFGALVDKVGRGTKIMILGSLMILLSHLIVAFAPSVPFFGYFGIAILGLGYSLVPAAMWPSIPKIIPENKLGTAFSLVYWIQNIGLFTAPIVVGNIINVNSDPVVVELFFIGLAVLAVVTSVLLSRSSDRHPELKLDEKVKM